MPGNDIVLIVNIIFNGDVYFVFNYSAISFTLWWRDFIQLLSDLRVIVKVDVLFKFNSI